jgi:hypothetical protein
MAAQRGVFLVQPLRPASLQRARDAILDAAATAALANEWGPPAAAAHGGPPHLGLALLSRRAPGGDARVQVRAEEGRRLPSRGQRTAVGPGSTHARAPPCRPAWPTSGRPEPQPPHLPRHQLLVRPNRLNLRELHVALGKLPAADAGGDGGAGGDAKAAAALPSLLGARRVRVARALLGGISGARGLSQHTGDRV